MTAPKRHKAPAPAPAPAPTVSALLTADLAAAPEAPSAATLERAVELATLLTDQQAHVARLEAELTEAKAAARRTEQEALPALMSELGLTEFRLKDGTLVRLTEDVQCGITEERRAAAHEWLVAHGHGGLLKVAVWVAFGRGERDAATALAERLAAELRPGGHAPVVKEEVHASTLKAWVKERLAAGEQIPLDLFGVHPFNRATLKFPKGA